MFNREYDLSYPITIDNNLEFVSDELLLPPSKGPSITPYFNGIPPSFQFKEGCKAEISVSFQGSPTPVAEWQFNSDEGANRYKVRSLCY